jgi:photosystem II stability/assembly factor-like uncharacterized protein
LIRLTVTLSVLGLLLASGVGLFEPAIAGGAENDSVLAKGRDGRSTAHGRAIPNGLMNGTWRWLSPRPQGNDLMDVCFVDGRHGWAVGDGSTILRTGNGGARWTVQRRGIEGGEFRAVAFADRRHGVVVGQEGVIVRTVDAGAHWTRVGAPTQGDLVGVTHIRRSAYLAVGEAGTLLRSADGGRTWRELDSPYHDGFLIHAAFADGKVGWVVGTHQTILRTTDSGRTWTVQHQGGRGFLLSVVARSRRECWAVGDAAGDGGTAVILHTKDRGRTWTGRRLPKTHFPLADLVFTGARTACALTTQGEILRTTDDCRSWRVARKADGVGLERLASRGRGRLLSVGLNGSLLTSGNGGRTWRSRTVRPLRNADAIDFLTARRGWAAGRGHIVTSTDGGARWKRVDVDSRSDDCWNAIDMVDARHGLAVGQDAAADDLDDAAIIARMDVRGRWKTVLRHGLPALDDVDMVDARYGWAVGGAGTILRTTDGGATWQPQDSGFQGFLAGVCALDRQRAWAAGAGGTILRTTDGGRIWAQAPEVTDAHLYAVTFVDGLHGWAGGEDETILRTVDGGASWSVARVDESDATVSGFSFVSPSTGWAAAGGVHAVLYTTDGGATWHCSSLRLPVRLDISSPLTGIDFLDARRGWVVGADGLLITSTGGR